MYQSQCSQVNHQCFQHLAPHTQIDGSISGFQIFLLEAASVTENCDHYGVGRTCPASSRSCVHLPERSALDLGLWSAISYDGVSFVPLACLAHLK